MLTSLPITTVELGFSFHLIYISFVFSAAMIYMVINMGYAKLDTLFILGLNVAALIDKAFGFSM